MVNAFLSKVCPDINLGVYCGTPWTHKLSDTCCGICPQPAITGHGTLMAVIIASSFNLLRILIEPTNGRTWIMTLLIACDAYNVPAMIRVWMGETGYGNVNHGLQKFHIQFSLISISASLPTLCAAVFTPPAYLHGFGDDEDGKGTSATVLWEAYRAQVLNKGKPHRGRSLPPNANLISYRLRGLKTDLSFTRISKWAQKYFGWILWGMYAAHLTLWTTVYASMVWSGGVRKWEWQPSCGEVVNENMEALLHGSSYFLLLMGWIMLLLLLLPVWKGISVGHFVDRLFHGFGQGVTTKKRGSTIKDTRGRHISSKKEKEEVDKMVKRERIIQAFFSITIYIVWATLGAVIFAKAHNNFLLVTDMWSYPLIQNSVLALSSPIHFFFGPFRTWISKIRETRAKNIGTDVTQKEIEDRRNSRIDRELSDSDNSDSCSDTSSRLHDARPLIHPGSRSRVDSPSGSDANQKSSKSRSRSGSRTPELVKTSSGTHNVKLSETKATGFKSDSDSNSNRLDKDTSRPVLGRSSRFSLHNPSRRVHSDSNQNSSKNRVSTFSESHGSHSNQDSHSERTSEFDGGVYPSQDDRGIASNTGSLDNTQRPRVVTIPPIRKMSASNSRSASRNASPHRDCRQQTYPTIDTISENVPSGSSSQVTSFSQTPERVQILGNAQMLTRRVPSRPGSRSGSRARISTDPALSRSRPPSTSRLADYSLDESDLGEVAKIRT